MESSNLPFEILESNSPVAVVVFSKYCQMERTLEIDKQLQALLGRCAHVVLDLSAVVSISAHWIRFFAVLTLRAARWKKTLSIYGARETVHEIADQLALEERFHYIDTMPEDAPMAIVIKKETI